MVLDAHLTEGFLNVNGEENMINELCNSSLEVVRFHLLFHDTRTGSVLDLLPHSIGQASVETPLHSIQVIGQGIALLIFLHKGDHTNSKGG
jgi:hypothetical protein